ncbi:hypothetical protein Tco_0684757 [Tanacetum coccineum]
MIEDDWELELKEFSFLGRGLNLPVMLEEVEKVRIEDSHHLEHIFQQVSQHKALSYHNELGKKSPITPISAQYAPFLDLSFRHLDGLLERNNHGPWLIWRRNGQDYKSTSNVSEGKCVTVAGDGVMIHCDSVRTYKGRHQDFDDNVLCLRSCKTSAFTTTAHHQSKDDELQYSLGFTPVDKDVEECEIQNNVDPEHNVTSGLGHKAKKGWIRELCSFHRFNFVAILETKMESMDLFSIKALLIVFKNPWSSLHVVDLRLLMIEMN